MNVVTLAFILLSCAKALTHNELLDYPIIALLYFVYFGTIVAVLLVFLAPERIYNVKGVSDIDAFYVLYTILVSILLSFAGFPIHAQVYLLVRMALKLLIRMRE